MEIKQKKRSEIADAFKWRLCDLIPSDEAWRAEHAACGAAIAAFSRFAGKLADAEGGPDAAALLACLRERDGIGEKLSRLYVYANMKLHEDANIAAYQGMADMAESAATKFMAATAFIEPELLALDADALTACVQNNEGLTVYTHYFDDLLRQKAHVLSAEAEAILANANEIGQGPDTIFAMLTNADMKFGFVTDDDGNRLELTHGRFTALMESRKPEVRRETFNTLYDEYWKLKNTITATYNASVKKDVFFATTRKHPSALDAALFGRNIPRSVYTRLIETVHEFLPAMHRYVRMRKKALGLNELHMYDLYTPIVPQVDTHIGYEEACEKVLAGLSPLGAAYVSAARDGIHGGWIDVYENEGKRSGAYSWGAFGGHPYVLLNYDNKVDDMFTLAHEMGHAMHSYYSWASQPFVYADYTIFLAEVASTVNEALLMEHLLQVTTDPAMRAYLINYFLEQFRGTLFRQTMFAEFEMITHEMAERGEPLTADALNAIYAELNGRYYGPDMVVDDKIALEWGRIPHFYSAFYVYQYATGYSAAIALANRILREGDTAAEAYRDFLKSGSSDYSIAILQKAGVDMSSPQPVREALTVFEGLLDKMEAVLV